MTPATDARIRLDGTSLEPLYAGYADAAYSLPEPLAAAGRAYLAVDADREAARVAHDAVHAARRRSLADKTTDEAAEDRLRQARLASHRALAHAETLIALTGDDLVRDYLRPAHDVAIDAVREALPALAGVDLTDTASVARRERRPAPRSSWSLRPASVSRRSSVPGSASSTGCGSAASSAATRTAPTVSAGRSGTRPGGPRLAPRRSPRREGPHRAGAPPRAGRLARRRGSGIVPDLRRVAGRLPRLGHRSGAQRPARRPRPRRAARVRDPRPPVTTFGAPGRRGVVTAARRSWPPARPVGDHPGAPCLDGAATLYGRIRPVAGY